MLESPTSESPAEPRTEENLECRLNDCERIAYNVNKLAGDNPYGAIYLIEQLEPHERTPALYGIVALRLAKGLTEGMIQAKEGGAQTYKDTPLHAFAERVLSYLDAKMSEYNGVRPAPAQPDQGRASRDKRRRP